MVKLTQHELVMLDYYWTLPEDQQTDMRETMEVILANIQDEMKPMVRQVLMSMSSSGEEKNHTT